MVRLGLLGLIWDPLDLSSQLLKLSARLSQLLGLSRRLSCALMFRSHRSDCGSELICFLHFRIPTGFLGLSRSFGQFGTQSRDFKVMRGRLAESAR